MAKHANIISVKVFNKSQSGSLAGILAGFDWISNHTRSKAMEGHNVKSVINMSWGFHDTVWRYEFLWYIINSIPAIPVAAAGNTGEDACQYAPARFKSVITVSATDKKDRLVYDYGHCVDILAPGVNIQSAAHNNSKSDFIKSGTSMAAAFVSGVIARHLQVFASQPKVEYIREILQNTASKGKTDAGRFETPDLLIYASCNSESFGQDLVEGLPEKSDCVPVDITDLDLEPILFATPGKVPDSQTLPPDHVVHVNHQPGAPLFPLFNNVPNTELLTYPVGTSMVILITSLVGVFVMAIILVSVLLRCREKVGNICEDEEPDETVLVVQSMGNTPMSTAQHTPINMGDGIASAPSTCAKVDTNAPSSDASTPVNPPIIPPTPVAPPTLTVPPTPTNAINPPSDDTKINIGTNLNSANADNKADIDPEVAVECCSTIHLDQ